MAVISQPNLLPGEFASDGDKNTIPANNDGLSGLASIAKGFPPITQQPLASGGLPPQRADFNGIFNLISQFLLYYQSGGVFTYSATLDYNPPAMVGDDEGNIYMCIAQNGPDTTAGVQEISNTSYWVKIINANTLETILQDYALKTDLNQYALSSALNNYVPLSGGNMTGILNLFANSTIPTPDEQDNSQNLTNTEWVQTWVQNFVNVLSTKLTVETQPNGNFSCPSLGITGLSDINGYISFGKLFGGLIIQHGTSNTYLGEYPYAACNVNFPINFTKNYVIFALHSGNQPVMINELYTSHTLSGTILEAVAYDGSKNPNWIINWVAIGC